MNPRILAENANHRESPVTGRAVPSIRLWIVALVALIATASMSLTGAMAADKNAPIKADISVELEHDWTTNSDDPDAEIHDTFATIEVGLEARLTRTFAVKSTLDFETVQDPEPGEDRFFDDHGLYAEEIFGEYEDDIFAVRAGKFGQKFGIAWDAAPGIWGTDFAEDYELSEQIGIALDIGFGAKAWGQHVVTVGTFFTDTTFLSDSIITSRGRTKKSDGGAGNTEDFSSFSIALEGEQIPALRGVSYHLAYTHRDSDAAGETDETGLAAGLVFKFKLGAFDVMPLIELASLNDFGGAPGVDAEYLTTSVEVGYGSWSLALSRTGRTISESGMSDIDDHLFQISAGYEFENGISLSAGWRHAEEEGIDSDTVGLVIAKNFSI